MKEFILSLLEVGDKYYLKKIVLKFYVEGKLKKKKK
jgi:hypothetical protein